MLVYEWVHGMEYTNRILHFLYEIDAIMVPKLSERVEMASYAGKLAQKAETLFISENGNDIASCSVYCNTETGFITSIAVNDKYARRHIGTDMLSSVKQHARKLGCKKILLEVHCQNIGALSFYKKNEFAVTKYDGDWAEMEYLIKRTEDEEKKIYG